MAKNKQSLWIWIIALLIGAIAIAIVLSGPNDSNPDDSSVVIEINENDWVKGNPDGEIQIVEYSDFQCPACKAYSDMIIEPLMKEFSNHIAFAYRHFPLKSIHPNSTEAARAAEAAGMQGKFFEMHDILFANQAEWSALYAPSPQFEAYAINIGLDIDQFNTAMASSEIAKKVDDSFDYSESIGLNSTPSFFLNGKKLDNPGSLEEFRTLIIETLGN